MSGKTEGRSETRVLFFVLIVLFSVLFFSIYPEFDIYFSGFFYDHEKGFFLKKNPFFILLYESIELFIPLLVLFCLGGMVFMRVARRRLFFGFGYLSLMYIVVALALGPGLVVNGILKELWGRARPATVKEFGGKLEFTPALVLSDQCESNCSFASGHASAGFFPVAISFARPDHRRKFLFAGLFYGFSTGLARIVQGGHFLSDVIFAGLIVYGLSWIIWTFFDRKRSINPS